MKEIIPEFELPSVPSELITLALADVEKSKKDSHYFICTNVWHEIAPNGRCAICIAGAVMVFSLNAPKKSLSPDFYPLITKNKLKAIDEFRRGLVGNAFKLLGLDFKTGHEFSRNIIQYANDKQCFKSQMQQLASDLKKAGY